MTQPDVQLAQLTQSLSASGPQELEVLLPEIYEQLRRLARAQMRDQSADHTLQATALVNETVIRLLRAGPRWWSSQGDIVRCAATVMRQILVDHARTKKRLKRSPTGDRVPLDEIAEPLIRRVGDLESLDKALVRLAAADPMAAELIELRFFLDLSMAEAAEVLGISKRSAEREWTTARAWLAQELRDDT